MQIQSELLFPSLVWTTLFDDRESFNNTLLELAYQMREKDTAGVSKTNIKGWQSANNLQQLKEFQEINVRILRVCQGIGQSLNFMPNLLYDLQAWININPPGASNMVHHHANCHFSGVYYISVKSPECGRIFFRDPRVASRMMTYPAQKENDFTAGEVYMRPEAGRMFVFPGWLEHGVEENQSDQDRVGISFNVLAMPRPTPAR